MEVYEILRKRFESFDSNKATVSRLNFATPSSPVPSIKYVGCRIINKRNKTATNNDLSK